MSKTVKILLISLLSVILFIEGSAVYGVYDYIQGSAKFEYFKDESQVIEVEKNKEYTTDAFAILIRGINPEIYTVAWNDTTDSDGYILSEDKTTITFTRSGEAVITLVADGARTEGNSIKVKINVS